MIDNGEPVVWLSVGMSQVPGDDGWMDEELAKRLDRLRYTKRQSEARLARWTAKLAVAKALDLDDDPAILREIAIRNARDGAPYATVDGEPISAVIAMTDRADWAVCAVLPGEVRIGCDLELVEPRSSAFVRDYFTAVEQEAVTLSVAPDVAANVIWSAKESALKVLRTGLRRDTRTVEVRLHGDTATSWEPLEVHDVAGSVFPGWWIQYGEFVLTVAAEQATQPPIALDGHPSLATAVPSHGWMDDLARS